MHDHHIYLDISPPFKYQLFQLAYQKHILKSKLFSSKSGRSISISKSGAAFSIALVNLFCHHTLHAASFQTLIKPWFTDDKGYVYCGLVVEWSRLQSSLKPRECSCLIVMMAGNAMSAAILVNILYIISCTEIIHFRHQLRMTCHTLCLLLLLSTCRGGKGFCCLAGKRVYCSKSDIMRLLPMLMIHMHPGMALPSASVYPARSCLFQNHVYLSQSGRPFYGNACYCLYCC